MHGLGGGRWLASSQLDAPPPTRQAPVLPFTFIRRVLASFGTQLDAKTTLCRVLDAKIFKVKHERNNSRRNLGPLASLGGGSLAEPQPPKRQCNQES